MTLSRLPADDAPRVEALRRLSILDTPAEERFDRVVRFAANEFSCPIALVSLVDKDRQWFKARVGLEACETAREVSFCSHAIEGDSILTVEDAAVDPRFADNPLVVGSPFIRFYAGAPLVAPGGHRVGTLCLIDLLPRTLDQTDRAILESLRDLVQHELLACRVQP